MTKVYVNYEDKNTPRHLSDALSILSKININAINAPSDFGRRVTFNNLKQSIRNINNELKNIQTWLNNSYKDYETLAYEMEQNVSRIPDFELSKNESIVK